MNENTYTLILLIACVYASYQFGKEVGKKEAKAEAYKSTIE